MYGRHFNDTDQITSLITRETIDTLKEHFRDDMTKEDWQTVLKLKKIFGIV
jgi:translation initiation factor 5B